MRGGADVFLTMKMPDTMMIGSVDADPDDRVQVARENLGLTFKFQAGPRR
jgi:hypothetical protein